MQSITTSDDFTNEVSNAEGLVVVDFWAEWCSPCKMLIPVLDRIEGELEDKVKIVKANTEEDAVRELAIKYNVSSIPCLIFFKDGAEVKRLIGLQSFNVLKAAIEENA